MTPDSRNQPKHEPTTTRNATAKKPAKASPATSKRRQDLRKKLAAAARATIERDGTSGLNARDLAKEVGCSVGTIYNVFDDLDGLKIAVNSATLARLDHAIIRALPEQAETPTSDQTIATLQALGTAYAQFARQNANLWRALFEDALKDQTGDVPDWHLDEHARLMAHIEDTLRHGLPHLEDEDVTSLARLMFSCVHGVVLLGLQNLFVAIPDDEVEAQINRFVQTFMQGLEMDR